MAVNVRQIGGNLRKIGKVFLPLGANWLHLRNILIGATGYHRFMNRLTQGMDIHTHIEAAATLPYVQVLPKVCHYAHCSFVEEFVFIIFFDYFLRCFRHVRINAAGSGQSDRVQPGGSRSGIARS
ncbi:hypothetical protein SLH49_13980 [Cognatiyoonia sp. IB215446]|uniref:hypothetical protein n=1 Tax=Cognatiyoonia sp. IB215446 TaxID=3097355 RepID=UPI002A17AB37|nr:hypothetical protein [Cognatiyoonia sp. IB215446]MDX8349091.1 hypothetical protein [Cognatiyoonia sp. IB215446]